MSDTSKDLPVSDDRAGESLGISADEVLDELAILFEAETTPPPGSFTLRQFMERSGATLDAGRSFLNRRVKSGQLQSVKYGNAMYYYYREQEAK